VKRNITPQQLQKYFMKFKKHTKDGKNISSVEELQKIMKKLNLDQVFLQLVKEDLLMQNLVVKKDEEIIESAVKYSGKRKDKAELEKQLLAAQQDPTFSRLLAEMWFSALDEDGNGLIDFPELIIGLAHFTSLEKSFDSREHYLFDASDHVPIVDYEDEKQRAILLFKVYDLDHSGTIEKREFFQTFKKSIETSTKFSLALSRLVIKDAALQYKLLFEPLATSAQNHVTKVTSDQWIQERVDDIFSVADTNQDGKLTLEEYIDAYTDPHKRILLEELSHWRKTQSGSNFSLNKIINSKPTLEGVRKKYPKLRKPTEQSTSSNTSAPPLPPKPSGL